MNKLLDRYEKALSYMIPKLTGDYEVIGNLVFDKAFMKEPKVFVRWIEINDQIGELYQNGSNETKELINQMIKKFVGET